MIEPLSHAFVVTELRGPTLKGHAVEVGECHAIYSRCNVVRPTWSARTGRSPARHTDGARRGGSSLEEWD